MAFLVCKVRKIYKTELWIGSFLLNAVANSAAVTVISDAKANVSTADGELSN